MPKYLQNRQNSSIYQCAQELWKKCFVEDKSLLFTGPLWTLKNIQTLHNAFVLNPDESNDKKFFEKLNGQISGSDKSIVRLAAEFLCVYYLFPSPSSISGHTKKKNVNEVLSWSGDEIPSGHVVLKAFECGIGGTGTAYNTLLFLELAWLMDVLIAFKKRSRQERLELEDPWKFKEFIDSVPMQGNRQSRHTLLHLIFPDTFERIATSGDKAKIIEAFGSMVADKSVGMDEQLTQIRQRLDEQYPGRKLDFYNPPLREEWKPEKTAVSGSLEEEFLAWFADQKKSDGNSYSPSSMGQYVNALKKASRRLEGVEIEPTNLFYYSTLADFSAVHEKILAAPNYAEVNQHFASGAFAAAMNRYKDFLTERTTAGGPKAGMTDKIQPPAETGDILSNAHLDEYFEGCFLSRETIRQMLTRLIAKKNLILQGPPGTGKTWLAKRLAYALAGEKDSDRVGAMQFHATLSYEDFVCGWRPTGDRTLELIDGPFLEYVTKAQENSAHHVMVIEEINRGNPAQIFGEMLTLLEADKRVPGEALRLCYQKKGQSRKIYIPENLYLIGTMNIADRSLAIVDFALRRRFAFFNLHPAFDTKVWKNWMIQKANLESEFIEIVAQKMTHLNEEIAKDQSLGSQYVIGHSYFTSDKPISKHKDWYEAVVDTEILPLLREYWFDNPAKALDAVKELRAGIV